MAVRFCGMTEGELEGLSASLGIERFRVGQILRWVYQRGVTDFEGMTDLPVRLREKLGEQVELVSSCVTARVGDPDGTVKLLVELGDGNGIECVLIRRGRLRSGCLSTQVGCPVRCVFCASGSEGLVRNLDAAEIVEQVVHLCVVDGNYERLDNVVFMGVGEPLFNYDEVVRAVRILNSPGGLAFAARRMTISTVGVPGTIERLADEGLQVNLAISLHSADDATRRRLVPHSGLMNISDLVGSADYYRERTGRDVTFEYVLVAGMNDSREQAKKVVRLLAGRPVTVNVIELNEVPGSGYACPEGGVVKGFVDELRSGGLNVTHRRRRGGRAEAACGQLRLHRH